MPEVGLGMESGVFKGFEAIEVLVDDGTIAVRRGGKGPAVLLLHGFPETLLMWRDIAPLISTDRSVLCADLPGYGGSRAGTVDGSKRASAARLVRAMESLGHATFSVVGHDRGGRVNYRMALDHPDRVERLAVLDVAPTAATWDRADARTMLAFWPFSLLAQPEPLPERLIGACPAAIVDAALTQWGTPADVFPPAVRDAYVAALRSPEQVRAICADYRAAASLDREHDAADVADGRLITCPLLALWSAAGPLAEWYQDEGGPLALWRLWAADVRGEAVPGGHFFPEEHPRDTARRLSAFLDG